MHFAVDLPNDGDLLSRRDVERRRELPLGAHESEFALDRGLIRRYKASTHTALVQGRRELQGFKGFVMEVDDPRHAPTKRERIEQLARIRRFRTLAETAGLTLVAFDCNYKQPRLSLDEREPERPMLLLSARSRGVETPMSSTRAEALECLSFVYTEVYPDGFAVNPADSVRYRQYCSALLHRELSALPDPLGALAFSQLSRDSHPA